MIKNKTISKPFVGDDRFQTVSFDDYAWAETSLGIKMEFRPSGDCRLIDEAEIRDSQPPVPKADDEHPSKTFHVVLIGDSNFVAQLNILEPYLEQHKNWNISYIRVSSLMYVNKSWVQRL